MSSTSQGPSMASRWRPPTRATSPGERILRRRGELRYLQWAVFESSFEAMARGHWDRATERIEQAVALSRRTGSRPIEPMFLAQLGWIHRSRGSYSRALEIGREAVSAAPDVGHPWMVAIAECMLGWTLTELFALDEALEHLEIGLAAAQRDGAGNWLVRCLGHLAHALWLKGDAERAREAASQAEALLQEVTAPPGLAFLHGGHAYVATAEVWLGTGEPERAERLVISLLEASKKAGWLEVHAAASLVVGRARMAVGDMDGALDRLTLALEIADESGLPSIEWRTHVSAAQLRRAQGRADLALDHDSRASAVIDQTAAGIDGVKLRRAFRRGARAALGSGWESAHPG